MSLSPQKKCKKKNSKNKKEEINLEIEIKNSNPKISLKNEKKFSFIKSKKLIRHKIRKRVVKMIKKKQRRQVWMINLLLI